MADTLSFIPETPASMSDQLTTTPTPTSSSAKKLALAEHRYGREEMLSLYQENPPLPSRIARIPDLVRTEATQPLALIPLTDQEQFALAGTVNSHSVYGMRGGGGAGRGFYPSRGGAAGRGRRPRQDQYWPTTPDETRGAPSSLGAAYYQRQTSEPYRGTDGRPDGPGSRASRDTNWRFSSGTTPTGDGEDGGGWGKHWHSSTNSPVKPVGGRWREGSGWKEQRWQALPEWATDESTSDGGGKEKGKENRTGSTLGSFDTSGNFTMNEREPNEKEEEEVSPDQFPEDVFEEEPIPSEKDTSSHVMSKQEQRPSSPPVQQPPADKRTAPERVAGSSVASSGDSMEEMARRFEKAAEAVLSTDEETPSPRPNLSSQFFPSTHEQKQHQSQQQQHKQKHGKQQQQQQHNQKQPKQTEKQQVEKNALPSVDMTSWVYCDPQGDMQGPFTNQEMHDWFRAGYFTMDLMVRRLCDVVMLPLGQVITAWGRVPFAPGPPMPAMQSTDPYLRQLLQQPLQKQPQAQPESHHKDSVKVLSSTSAAPSDPIASSQSPASLLWGLAPESPTNNEEQWPELFTNEKHSSTPHQSVAMLLDERRDEEEKRNEKERKRLKDQAQAEEKKRQEEERKRKEEKRKQEEKLAEERRRLEMERQAEIKQREEEEKRLLEQERKRIEQEMMRAAEEKRREAELMRQQREYEEAQRRAEEEERKREEMQLALSPHHRGWNTVEHEPPSPRPMLHQQQQQQQQPTPSLLQIQREEQIIAEKERREMEELRMLHQHQQTVPIGGGWANMAAAPGGTSRPTSFLDIQKEQQGGGNRRQTKSNAPVAATPPSHQSFSWSKVACTNKQQSVSHQPKRQQPPQKKPTPTVVETNKAVAAFWEEAAMESDAAYNAKSAGGSKEEERVRKLFTTSPDEVLTNWCAGELAKFDVDVDPATFVSLLLEVESTYEVHDYIRSFLGETDEVHAFAKQFLDNRQKLKKNQQKKTHQKRVQAGASATTAVPFVKGATVNSSVVAEGSSARAAKKKNKKKMQKVHPSAMLGFTVNAAERPNAGEIQSAKDAV